MHTEAIKPLKQQITAGWHSMDSAACALMSSIIFQCHAWLRSAAIPVEIKHKIEDLPCKGLTIFSTGTDEMLFLIFFKKRTSRWLGLWECLNSTSPNLNKDHFYSNLDILTRRITAMLILWGPIWPRLTNQLSSTIEAASSQKSSFWLGMFSVPV